MPKMDRWKIIGEGDNKMLTGVGSGHPSLGSGVILTSVIQSMDLECAEPWVQTQNTLYKLAPGGERPPLDPDGSLNAGKIDVLYDSDQAALLQAAFDHDTHMEVLRLFATRSASKGATPEVAEKVQVLVIKWLMEPMLTGSAGPTRPEMGQ